MKSALSSKEITVFETSVPLLSSAENRTIRFRPAAERPGTTAPEFF